MFINLIENAIRYSHKNSTVTIETRPIHNKAQIMISDEGIGIPAQDLPHITERFYRVNKARSRADGGSGLGLSIVEQIMKHHEGSIKIESILGQGTKVTLMLPLMEEKR